MSLVVRLSSQHAGFDEIIPGNFVKGNIHVGIFQLLSSKLVNVGELFVCVATTQVTEVPVVLK